ncbi:hypothetical protein, partial [Klebsiella pneumoniae]|uniref:hypothetical protein n=1 Tax=Klebsiella pneumoniae TaxID=573 RepID=UPI00396960E7
DVIEQVKGIEGTFEFETYFSLSCQNCPDVDQALDLVLKTKGLDKRKLGNVLLLVPVDWSGARKWEVILLVLL